MIFARRVGRPLTIQPGLSPTDATHAVTESTSATTRSVRSMHSTVQLAIFDAAFGPSRSMSSHAALS